MSASGTPVLSVALTHLPNRLKKTSRSRNIVAPRRIGLIVPRNSQLFAEEMCHEKVEESRSRSHGAAAFQTNNEACVHGPGPYAGLASPVAAADRNSEAEAAGKEGVRLLKADRPREALPYLSKAIEFAPKDPWHYLHRGIAYCDLRQFEESLEDVTGPWRSTPGYLKPGSSRQSLSARRPLQAGHCPLRPCPDPVSSGLAGKDDPPGQGQQRAQPARSLQGHLDGPGGRRGQAGTGSGQP